MPRKKPPALQVEMVKTDDLIPYIRNAREHSDQQVGQIAASIKEFGFTNPILTDGSRGILAGHGRLMAAQKLGLGEVPTISLSHLTADQQRAYVIADNKLTLNGSWDVEMLLAEIQTLDESGFETPLLGFTDAELAHLAEDPWSSDMNAMENIESRDTAAKGKMTLLFPEPERDRVSDILTAAFADHDIPGFEID